MKTKVTIFVTLFTMLSVPAFAEQTNDPCTTTVDMTILALKQQSEKLGTEQKLHDLSIDEIKRIQSELGTCAAAQEINKRTMGSQSAQPEQSAQ